MSLHPDIAAVLAGERRWCVVEGDCLDALPTLPDRSVAHVITDPPYEAEAHTLQRRATGGTRRNHATGWRATDIVVDAPLDFPALTESDRVALASHYARLARRWTIVFCQAEAVALWRSSLSDAGAVYRRACVWIKPDGMPQLTGDRPGMGYESIVCAHAPGRSRWNGGGRLGVFTHVKNVTGSRTRPCHPTQKPDALMSELVELFTDADDIILDPTAGSGTTGVTALRLGRRAILIEREPKYAAIARERMQAEERGSTLQAARAGQVPLFAPKESP